ncbi:MAG: universal stress protein [Nitrospinae bacterium]|nr:universal stress protein [Nitrospinota bacterium]
MEIHHMLAPTDFSAYSMQAIDYAFALAQKFGAKLSLLHVIEMPAYPVDGYVPPIQATTLLEDLDRNARIELANILSKAEGTNVEVARHVVLGKPYREIVHIAAKENVDLIVMATHGRTGLSHLVMGSVAERVVRLAPCPVLTLRPAA